MKKYLISTSESCEKQYLVEADSTAEAHRILEDSYFGDSSEDRVKEVGFTQYSQREIIETVTYKEKN